MKPGDIVLVDWRDALLGSREPNKIRPAIVIGSPPFFGSGLPFEMVVPLTSEQRLAIAGASLLIAPTPENGCAMTCYALAWCVQTVPHERIRQTRSRVGENALRDLRAQIAACIAAAT